MFQKEFLIVTGSILEVLYFKETPKGSILEVLCFKETPKGCILEMLF